MGLVFALAGSLLLTWPVNSYASSCTLLLKNLSVHRLLPSRAIKRKSKAPLIQQSTNYTCGPAALLSWLKSKGDYSASELSLAKKLNTTPTHGTHHADFIKGINMLGYEAQFIENLNIKSLRDFIKKGYGVIVNIQLEGGGHWALLVDISPSGKTLTLMDPWLAKKGYRKLRRVNFENNWFDFFGPEKFRVDQAAIIISPIKNI